MSGDVLKPLFDPESAYMAPAKVTASVEEKLVIEGGKVKLATEGRQIAAKKNGGVIVDYLRFTVLRDRIIAGITKIPVDSDDQNVALLMALRFAELLGYTLGVLRPGRDYYEHTYTIENAFGHEVASVSGGGESQRDTFCFTLKGVVEDADGDLVGDHINACPECYAATVDLFGDEDEDMSDERGD